MALHLAGAPAVVGHALVMPWSSRSVITRHHPSGLLLAVRVALVDPGAALLAEPAGGDVLAQQRTRAVLVVAELAVQHLGDREAGVEADQVGELERPHRMVSPAPHAGIDVRRGAQPLVEPAARLAE